MRTVVEASNQFFVTPYNDVYDYYAEEWDIAGGAIRRAYDILQKEGDLHEDYAVIKAKDNEYVPRVDVSSYATTVVPYCDEQGICGGMAIRWLYELLNGRHEGGYLPNISKSRRAQERAQESREEFNDFLHIPLWAAGLRVEREGHRAGRNAIRDIAREIERHPGAWYFAYRVPGVSWGHDVAVFNGGSSILYMNSKSGVHLAGDYQNLERAIEQEYCYNFQQFFPVSAINLYTAKIAQGD